MNKIEKRYLPVEQSELRFESVEGSEQRLAGYAFKTNSLSQLMQHEKYGLFREVLRPGVVTRALANKPDVKLNIDHDNGRIIARTTAGNLRLSEDAVGLSIDASLPNTTKANDLKEDVRVGNITSMSFAFTVAPDGERWRREGDIHIRELLDINLFDVSCVVDPAYLSTEVGLRSEATEVAYRSFEAYMETREEAEPVVEAPVVAPVEEAAPEEANTLSAVEANAKIAQLKARYIKTL